MLISRPRILVAQPPELIAEHQASIAPPVRSLHEPVFSFLALAWRLYDFEKPLNGIASSLHDPAVSLRQDIFRVVGDPFQGTGGREKGVLSGPSRTGGVHWGRSALHWRRSGLREMYLACHERRSVEEKRFSAQKKCAPGTLMAAAAENFIFASPGFTARVFSSRCAFSSSASWAEGHGEL
jgi:hypothetical protein